jgi:hypothetical protein
MKQLLGSDWIDIDPTPSAIEANIAIDQRENGVIAAEADVLAWQKLGSALAHNDIAGDDQFATVFFYAETLANAVAAVLNAALSFFMSHDLGFL